MRHILFGIDDGYGGEYNYSSRQSNRASSHERVDDGSIRRHSNNRGTDVGTTLKRDEINSWRLPERIIKSLSHETSEHYRILLFDAMELHGLSFSASYFRAEKTFISMLFLSIDGTIANKSVISTRICRRRTRLSKTI